MRDRDEDFPTPREGQPANLACALRRGPLSRWAALGEAPSPASALGLHLRDCAACRAYLADLRGLAGDLRFAVAAPAPPERFAARVGQRIAAPGPRLRAGAATLCVAAGVAAAFLAAITTGGHSPAPQVAPNQAGVHLPSVQVATAPVPVQPPVRDAQITRPRRPLHLKRQPARRRPVFGPRGAGPLQLARRPAGRGHAVTTSPAGVGRVSPAALALCGLVSSNAGEHRLAAALYVRALEKGGPSALAFAAAEQAEAAGDMANAVDYYSYLLATPADAAGDSPSR